MHMYAIDYEDMGTPAVAEASTAPVTVEIDGHTVSVPEGTSVMRAAALAGVQVPKLCATDTLKAFGSCRLCLVEIEGRKGYPASCTTTVAPGMKISTESPNLTQWRRGWGSRTRLMDRPAPSTAPFPKTSAIPISPSTPPFVSSARAACAPAMR